MELKLGRVFLLEQWRQASWRRCLLKVVEGTVWAKTQSGVDKQHHLVDVKGTL